MSTTSISSKDDGLNRGFVIIDVDNLRGTFGSYNRWPPLDDLCAWIADPDNLGIDEVLGIVCYATVRDVDHPSHKEVPFRSLDPASLKAKKISLRLYPYTEIPTRGVTPAFVRKYLYRGSKQMGVPDETIMTLAFAEFSRYDTLVLVSSDSDFFNFAAKVRKGYNPFRSFSMPMTPEEKQAAQREVVVIASPKSAHDDWITHADNCVALEDIFPNLLTPVPVQD